MNMNDQSSFLSTPSSSLFDTYLVYGIIGLLILVAIIGLFVLLTTSCCCCYCCTTSKSCCLRCYSNRRHSSYKLSQKSKQFKGLDHEHTKINAFIRRHGSDVADFAQLYDSCPHLINSKAMVPSTTVAIPIHMNASCTTIDTIINPVSPCSSFRSFVQSGTVPKDNKLPSTVQKDLSNSPQSININIDATNNVLPTSVKGVCSRPFSYIKNINDRAQILRRFTQREHPIPVAPVSIDITRIASPELIHNNHPSNSISSNIYETVPPIIINSNINNKTPTSDISPPIYETEWTHSLRQLMMSNTATTTRSIGNDAISVIELPSSPPDLVPLPKQPSDYFQQRNPYDKFLASRTVTSDSMRRANMLRRLKDDAAFLY